MSCVLDQTIRGGYLPPPQELALVFIAHTPGAFDIL